MNNVLTVSQVNTYIKSIIESAEILNHLYISGEISNFTDHYKSGHIYLSIKDEKSVLKAVMFSTAAKRLRFKPKDGMKVLIRGKISVYEPSGQYQLYIEDMQPDGVGALNLAFEQLKEKLYNEGLFSDKIKKSLPIYPEKIAVITSPTGAAVQDIIRILGRRWPVAQVLLFPCTVQGEKAVPELLSALNSAINTPSCDVIIIGRGGGSIEDLWAFNSEELARKIASSKVPIISAVGHETDFTICDFAADLRASTPSAAAELATPNIFEEQDRFNFAGARIKSLVDKLITKHYQRLDALPSTELLIKKELKSKGERLKNLTKELSLISENKILAEKSKLGSFASKLDALSPLKVLSRGYNILMQGENVINSVGAVKIGEELMATVADGKLSLKVLDKEEKL